MTQLAGLLLEGVGCEAHLVALEVLREALRLDVLHIQAELLDAVPAELSSYLGRTGWHDVHLR